MDDKKLTARASRVLQLAGNKAREWGHTTISTDYLLYGLFAEGSGVAHNVLKANDVTMEKIEAQMQKTTFKGMATGIDLTNPFIEPLSYSPRCRSAFDFASGVAALMKHNVLGTEHLLLGLLEESNGVSMMMLSGLGISPESMKTEIFNLLGHVQPKVKEERTVQEECNYYKGIVDKIKQTLHEADEDALPKIRDILKDS